MTLESLLLNQFPQKEGLIYLNHAAVSPWPQRTAAAIQDFANENVRQGAQDYAEWLKIESQLREQCCRLVNAPSADDIALLKNTSEGLSVIAYGLPWQQGDNIVISDQEFPSNRIVWESLNDRGVELRQAALDKADSPEEAIIKQMDEHTRLLAISSVQYASGLRMDLGRLGEYCHANNILFCVDAIQSLGAIEMDAAAIHADFIVADGHKWMMGPEGLALFYCRPELRDSLKLKQFGWHMIEHHLDYNRKDWQVAESARRFECGSPNMLGIHGLHASLSLLFEIGMETVEKRLLEKTSYLIDRIKNTESLELLSPDQTERYAGIVSFRHKDITPERLHSLLTKNNVICAKRDHAVRLSPHFYTPDAKLDILFDTILVNLE